MARFAPVLDEQSPFEHDILGHLQNAVLEHGSQAVVRLRRALVTVRAPA